MVIMAMLICNFIANYFSIITKGWYLVRLHLFKLMHNWTWKKITVSIIKIDLIELKLYL